jgi:hypothetical protein
MFRAGAGAGFFDKLEPEPLKNGPVPQHWWLEIYTGIFISFQTTDTDSDLHSMPPKSGSRQIQKGKTKLKDTYSTYDVRVVYSKHTFHQFFGQIHY